jgi:hypothetical protein
MELLDLTIATPPWLPLAMAVVLLGVLGFLYWSMRRNIRRIDFEDKPESPRSPTE